MSGGRLRGSGSFPLSAPLEQEVEQVPRELGGPLFAASRLRSLLVEEAGDVGRFAEAILGQLPDDGFEIVQHAILGATAEAEVDEFGVGDRLLLPHRLRGDGLTSLNRRRSWQWHMLRPLERRFARFDFPSEKALPAATFSRCRLRHAGPADDGASSVVCAALRHLRPFLIAPAPLSADHAVIDSHNLHTDDDGAGVFADSNHMVLIDVTGGSQTPVVPGASSSGILLRLPIQRTGWSAPPPRHGLATGLPPEGKSGVYGIDVEKHRFRTASPRWEAGGDGTYAVVGAPSDGDEPPRLRRGGSRHETDQHRFDL